MASGDRDPLRALMLALPPGVAAPGGDPWQIEDMPPLRRLELRMLVLHELLQVFFRTTPEPLPPRAPDPRQPTP